MKAIPFAVVVLAAAAVAQQEPKQQPAPASAPATQSDEAALQRAVAAQEVEHDAKRAVAMLRAIADGDGPSELRRRASLRLGKLLRELGEEAEARNALQRAAEGDDAVATEAKALLAEQDPQGKDAQEARIRAAIAGLIAQPTSQAAATNLLWIGKPAVPDVIDAVEAKDATDTLVANAGRVLLQIGGPEVEAWLPGFLKQADSAARIAVLQASRRIDPLSPPVVDTLSSLLEDPDPRVRGEAVSDLNDRVSAHVVIAMLGDPDMNVRGLVLNALRNWGALQHSDAQAEAEEVGQRLLALLPHMSADEGQRLLTIVYQQWLLAVPAGRELYLAVLQRPAFQQGGYPGIPNDAQVGPTELADEAVQVAKRLGPLRHGTNQRLPASQGALVAFLNVLVRHWGAGALPDVFALIEQGYGAEVSALGQFLGQYASATDVPRVAKAVAHLDDAGGVATWFERRVADLGEKDVAMLVQALAPRIASWPIDGDLLKLLTALAKQGSRPAAHLLQSLAAHGDTDYSVVAQAMEAASSPAMVEAMRQAMQMEMSGNGAAQARNKLFGRLLQLGAVDPVDPFVRAYRLGLATDSYRPGLGWLRDDGVNLAPDDMKALVQSVLKAGGDEAWKDAAAALVPSDVMWNPTNPAPPSSLPTVSYLFDAAWKSPQEVRSKFLVWLAAAGQLAEGYEPFLRRMLADKEFGPVVLSKLAAGMDVEHVPIDAVASWLSSNDSVTLRNAITLLGKLDAKDELDAIVPLLQSDDYLVQQAAIEAVGRLAGDRRVELLAPVVDRARADQSRLALINVAIRTLDPGFVPILLDLLHSDNADVRKNATDAIKAIEFYQQQTRRWQQVQAASGLDDASAAAALIRKAKDGNPRETRLLAIQSLGALGAPETTPFLLELVDSDDADLAKAARDALLEIHRAAQQRHGG